MRCGVGGKRLSVGAVGDVARGCSSRSGSRAPRACGSLPSSRSASSARLGPTSPTTSACGKIDLLDARRRVADVDDLRARRPMMNGGFSTVSWPIAMIRSAWSIASCT